MIPRPDILKTVKTDKERILLILVNSLYCLRYDEVSGGGAHAAAYKPPAVGDLVIGSSTGQIGWVKRISEDSDFVRFYIRPIGENYLEEWAAEEFLPILGIDPQYLLEGQEFEFRSFVEQAIQASENLKHRYRLGGISFSDGDCTIVIRDLFQLSETQIQIPGYSHYLQQFTLFEQLILRHGIG